MTWLKEIRRSKLKFGLLASAVGLLFFLLLFVNTLSSTLLGGFIGAIENNSADLLVFAEDAQATIPASRLTPDDLERVSAVPGVSAVAPISEVTTDAAIAGETTNVSIWGVEIGGPGTPAQINEGALPMPGQALVDSSARDAGLQVGSILEVGGTSIEVSGIADNATYSVLPTVYVDTATWAGVFRGLFPEAPLTPFNLIGVEIDGAVRADVVSAISDLDGLEALTPADAAAATPGVSSIQQSFGLITGITFVIVIIVVGFFFQILTVQKLRVFALLEALGSQLRALSGYVLAQIGFLVAIGVVVGTGLLAVTAFATRDVFAISVDPILTTVLGGSILLASLLSGLTSIRRIASQDAAAVTTSGGTR